MATAFEVVGGTDLESESKAELPEIAAEQSPGLERASEEARKARILFEALNEMGRGKTPGIGYGEGPGVDGTLLEYFDYDVDAAAEAMGIDLSGGQN